ncbi:MAG: hypothetical protein HN802_05695 [Candidatus Jacksonbacteria bacterium]|jgi:hypothetical protein|nr:hypothetical protein [Candidatus Jacksonbacteria bacterium]MBT7683947.1 hypothetical protein [Candidatus Neomarinimicrobiota bacterium]
MSIDELERKIGKWRRNKTSIRDRMPENCWEAAVELAGKSSASRVASRLKINVNDLKRRMAHQQVATQSTKPKSLKSITLKEIPLSSRSSGYLFEIVSPNGTIIRVYQ